MTRLSVAALARDTTEILARVANTGERIVVRKGNRNMALIIPIQDAGHRERMTEEDRLDAAEADHRLSDPNEKRVPYHVVRANAGLA